MPILAQRPRSDRAFERIYQRHVGDVYRYALVVLRNEADAEDVTQTTFLNAYRAFKNGEDPRTPQNWLIAIAHNVCRQRFRQASRRPYEVAYEEELADRSTGRTTICERSAVDAPVVRTWRVVRGAVSASRRPTRTPGPPPAECAPCNGRPPSRSHRPGSSGTARDYLSTSPAPSA